MSSGRWSSRCFPRRGRAGRAGGGRSTRGCGSWTRSCTWHGPGASGGTCRRTSHPGPRCTGTSPGGTTTARWRRSTTPCGSRSARPTAAAPEPSAGQVDSQSVRAADTVPTATSGFDAGKKPKGRKRFIVTDTLGLLPTVHVLAASVQDRDGARRSLLWTRLDHPTVTRIWADQGFAGRLVDWCATVLHPHLGHRPQGPTTTGLQGAAQAVGGRAHVRVDHHATPPGLRLRTRSGTLRNHDWLGHDRRDTPPTHPRPTRHTPRPPPTTENHPVADLQHALKPTSRKCMPHAPPNRRHGADPTWHAAEGFPVPSPKSRRRSPQHILDDFDQQADVAHRTACALELPPPLRGSSPVRTA